MDTNKTITHTHTHTHNGITTSQKIQPFIWAKGISRIAEHLSWSNNALRKRKKKETNWISSEQMKREQFGKWKRKLMIPFKVILEQNETIFTLNRTHSIHRTKLMHHSNISRHAIFHYRTTVHTEQWININSLTAPDFNRNKSEWQNFALNNRWLVCSSSIARTILIGELQMGKSERTNIIDKLKLICFFIHDKLDFLLIEKNRNIKNIEDSEKFQKQMKCIFSLKLFSSLIFKEKITSFDKCERKHLFAFSFVKNVNFIVVLSNASCVCDLLMVKSKIY